MEKTGKIKDLKFQVEFTLQEGFTGLDGNKVRPIKYIADFTFNDLENNRFRVFDTKGYHNEVYAIKRKMFDYHMKDKGIMLEENI